MSIKNYNTIQNSNGVNKKIFIVVLLVIFMVGLFTVLIPQQVSAQEDPPERDPCELNSQRDFEKAVPMQLAIPGVTYKFDGKHYVKDMACYISGIYRYFAGVAGILCVVMIMYGGIKYVISMGNSQKMSDAQDTIVSAMLGLVLTLGSFVILYFINPNLTTLKVTGIDTIVGDPGIICDNRAEKFSYKDSKSKFFWESDGTGVCGDVGILNDKYCRFDRCPINDAKHRTETFKDEEWHIDDPYKCVLGTETDPNKRKDGNNKEIGWNCMPASAVCEREDSEGSCPLFTVEGRGKCKFWNVPLKDDIGNWWADLPFFLAREGLGFESWRNPFLNETNTDGCRYWTANKCGQLDGLGPMSNWQRVDCDECNAKGKDCSAVAVSWFEDSGLRGIGEFLGLLSSNTICQSDATTPVYFMEATSDKKYFQGICCKFLPDPRVLKCFNGQDL